MAALGFTLTAGLSSTPAVVAMPAVPALGFAISALLFRYVDVPEEPAPPRTGMWAEAAAGVRFTLTHPPLRAIVVYLVALAALQPLMGETAEDPAGPAGSLYWVVMLAPLAGALAAFPLHRRAGALRLAWLAVLLTQPFALLLAFMPGAAGYVLGQALPLAGAATVAIALLSHRQAITPPRLLGRSGGTLLTLVAVAAAVGSLLKVLAEEFLVGVGPSLVPAMAAAGVLAATVPLIRASRYERSGGAGQDMPTAVS